MNLFETIKAYNEDGGLIIYLLFIIAILIWTFYFRFLVILRERVSNHDIETHLDGSAKSTKGATFRMLTFVKRSLISKMNIEEACDMAREAETAEFFGHFRVLSALVAAAPLFGLLGTVIGMIATFNAVSGSGETDAMIADGISKALVTTQAGLAVALPGTFAIVHLKRLFKQLKNIIDRNESRIVILLEEGKEL